MMDLLKMAKLETRLSFGIWIQNSDESYFFYFLAFKCVNLSIVIHIHCMEFSEVCCDLILDISRK